MAEFSDSVAGNEDQATSADFYLEATDGGFCFCPTAFLSPMQILKATVRT